jgi:hypothetical protein
LTAQNKFFDAQDVINGMNPQHKPVLATYFIRRFFFEFLAGISTRRLSFSPKVGSVYSSKKHGDHLKDIFWQTHRSQAAKHISIT